MRLEVVDYLKGYSISTIVLFHLLQYFALPDVLSKAISFGGAGVHVFILCSGFGLCLSQLNKPLSYGQFLKRRLLKIYFPYIIVIFISASIPFIYINADKIMAVCSHVFLFKMFSEHFENSFGGQFWFISTILQFYVIFPILFIIIKKCKWRSLAGGGMSIIISLLYATIVGLTDKSYFRVWNSFFLQYLWEFVLGMILAKEFYKNRDFIKIPQKKYLFILALAGIAITGFTGSKGGILKMYNDIPSLVGYLSFALLLYSLDIKKINNFFTFTNKFSYEWYLVHILIFNCVFYFFTKAFFSPFISGGLALVLSYVFAIIYHQIVKKVLYSII
jgi:peptidoglycan/LPS O-acetylase OafA/YrhL